MGQVLLHSSAVSARLPEASLDFETNLRSYGNKTLWRSLDYDDDGSWILEGMINRCLIISHDGSYMKEVSPSISAAAMMMGPRGASLPIDKQAPRGALLRSDLAWSGK
jgi:hypothetical protein